MHLTHKREFALGLLLTFCILFSYASICPVQATPDTLVDSYDTGNTHFTIYATNHPSGTDTSAVGQSFNATINANITSVQLYLERSGTPTALLRVRLCVHSGTYGISSIGDGDILATSTAINASTLSLTPNWSWITFTFNTTNQYSMVANTKYCLYVYGTGGVINATNTVRVKGDDATASHSGNAFRYASGDWSVYATADCMFQVWGETPPPPEWHSVESWWGNMPAPIWRFVEQWWGKFLVSGWGIVEYWRSSHPIGNTYFQLATLLGWAGFLGVFLFFPMLAIGGKIRNSKLVLSSFIMLSVGLMLLGVFVVYKIFALI